MPRLCLICHHPQRRAIDGELAAGATLSEVGRRYSLTKQAVSRHRDNHLKDSLPLRRRYAQAPRSDVTEPTQALRSDVTVPPPKVPKSASRNDLSPLFRPLPKPAAPPRPIVTVPPPESEPIEPAVSEPADPIESDVPDPVEPIEPEPPAKPKRRPKRKKNGALRPDPLVALPPKPKGVPRVPPDQDPSGPERHLIPRLHTDPEALADLHLYEPQVYYLRQLRRVERIAKWGEDEAIPGVTLNAVESSRRLMSDAIGLFITSKPEQSANPDVALLDRLNDIAEDAAERAILARLLLRLDRDAAADAAPTGRVVAEVAA